MSFFADALRRDEQVSYSLRGLFESRGYKRYKVSKFEEYGLYLENKNFLSSERVVTFNAPDGRLLALRPDVTLSIAKSTKASMARNEKLYYIENVYRLSHRTGEYEEINQMGLEFFGNIDGFATAEVVKLALLSLSAIDDDFVLDISHMGFAAGLLDSFELDAEKRRELLEYIRSKNTHDLEKAALSFGISEADTARLSKLTGIYGSFEECLSAADEISDGNCDMQTAVSELRELGKLLGTSPLSGHLRLDFSIVNDIDYYNGVIFQGYVKRVPHAVLSGGRYDNLLARFGHDAGAVGFALYLDEIGARYTSQNSFDADAFVLYDNDSDLCALSDAVEALIADGNRVRAEKNLPDDLRCAHVYKFENGALKEVVRNA